MSNYPTNVGVTGAKSMATPLVIISDGVNILVALGCSMGSFFRYFGTNHHHMQASDIGWVAKLRVVILAGLLPFPAPSQQPLINL